MYEILGKKYDKLVSKQKPYIACEFLKTKCGRSSKRFKKYLLLPALILLGLFSELLYPEQGKCRRAYNIYIYK